MKSVFFTIVISAFLTVTITACSSDSKKTETPKAADVKASTTTTKAVAPKAEATVASATASAGVITCTQGSDSRSIELKTAGAVCELMYTKNGEAKSIATAKNGTEYCAGVSDKVVKNLSAAGFSCK